MTDDLDVTSFDALVAGGWLPNIQKYFLKEGIQFSNSFVTDPVCCPSRATFLSGQYSHNHGVITVSRGLSYWLKDGKPDGEKSTIATWLQAQDYYTGHIGKYLNGYGMFTSQEYVPPGYDDWQGLIDPFTYQVYGYRLNDNGAVIQYGFSRAEYQTDVIAKRTVEFLDGHAKKAKDKPFFAMVAPMAPHIEVLPKYLIDDLVMGYRGNFRDSIRPAPRHKKYADGFRFNGELPDPPAFKKPSFNESDVTDKVAYIQGLPQINYRDRRAIRKQYKERLASMLAVDDLVGTIMKRLQASGELENTVVFFTSDNGYHFGEHRLSSKLSPYEESIRVPLLARGPGMERGKSCDKMVLNNDLAPTLSSLANATPTRDVDGRSIVPLLYSSNHGWDRKQFLINYFREQGAAAVAGEGANFLEEWDFGGGLQNFPTYKALRKIHGTEDIVFVNWWEELNSDDIQDPGQLGPFTAGEYYNLRSDPYQLTSRYSFLGTWDRLMYQNLLFGLSRCSGAQCRTWENQ